MLGAHVTRAHLESGRYAEAVAQVVAVGAEREALHGAAEWILNVLKKAPKGSARDNGFLALIPQLIVWGEAELAFAAIDSLGTDSNVAGHRSSWLAQLDALAKHRLEALRGVDQPGW